MKLCFQVVHNTLQPIVEVIEEVIEEVDIELCSIYNEGAGMQVMGTNPAQDSTEPFTRKPSLRRTKTVQRNSLQIPTPTTPTTPITSNPE